MMETIKKPDVQEVKKFCKWWENGECSSKEYRFENANIDFKTIQQGEKLLDSVFEEVKRENSQAMASRMT